MKTSAARAGASAKADRRLRSRTDQSSTGEAFPPLSVSLKSFVKGQSDREFRRLIYSLVGLAHLMARNREHFGRYIGVTDPQYVIITLIAESTQATVGKLAEQMNVTSQFITIEVGKLLKKNIVEKRPNHADRRSSLLHLTPKGDRLLSELGPLRRRTNDLMFRSLTQDGTKVLQQILDTLLLDGKSALHELEAPHMRGTKALSARSEAENDTGAGPPASALARGRAARASTR